MIKKYLLFCLSLAVILAASMTANAADVVITSIGQSSDGMMVKALLKKLEIESDYEALMTPEAVKGQKVLIAVVGGSLKGLGAARINKEREKTRGRDVIGAARKKNIKVIIMHVGGGGRRGDLSDMFIAAVTEFGDMVIVVKDGNADKIFNKLKAPSVKLVETDSIQATATPLKDALKEYGVIR